MKNKQYTLAVLFLFTFSPIALSTDTLHRGENITDGQNLSPNLIRWERLLYPYPTCTLLLKLFKADA
jgi:hypothetical protein